jgi:hypothetical protein
MWKGTNGKSPTLRIQEKIGLDVTVGYRLKWNELSLRFTSIDFGILLEITLEFF